MGRPWKRVGHEARHLEAERADQVQRRLRRIDERPEDVEHRAHAERGAHRRDRLHRRVIVGREQEGEVRSPRGRRAARRAVERDRQAERLEHVGAAAAAGDRAVAVLHHRHPAGGGQQRGAGRDVEAAGGIPAGADDVDARARPAGSPAGAPGGAWRARSRAPRRPTTPLVRSAASIAPAIAGGSSPVRSAASSSSSACACVRSRRSSSCSQQLTRSGIGTPAHPRPPLAGGKFEEVPHQRRAVGREDALGMELHALDHAAPGAARP